MALADLAATFNNGVRTTKSFYNKQTKIWKRCRDVISGTDAVKNEGRTYLPKLKDQSEESYSAYKMRANFFNATGRTHGGLVGMIFRKPPVKTVPDGNLIITYLNNIDLSGNPLDIFARKVIEEVIAVGNNGMLVDFPKVKANSDTILTVAQAQALNLRPAIKSYSRESIINWRWTVVNNAKVLGFIVLKECIEVIGDSEFETLQQEQFRVLDLDENGFYRQRLYIISKDGRDELIEGPIYPIMNGRPLSYIPFKFACEDDANEPPLLDMVDVNLGHYRLSADYETGCHFTGLPMLYVFGMQGNLNPDGSSKPIYVGSDEALVSTNPETKAGYVEFTGGGLLTIENNLDRKENQMALLGARIIAQEKKTAETAMTANIHRVGENSVLADISIETSLSLTQCLRWFFDWLAIPSDEVDYQLNKDFMPVVIDGPTLTSYLGALQAGAISEEELFDLLQRGDIIEADVVYEDHKGQVAAYAAQKVAEQEATLALTQKYATKPANQPGA